MMDLLDKMMVYEDGRMDMDETIDLFQELINSSAVWTLKGSYGRMASYLIDIGCCTQPKPKKP